MEDSTAAFRYEATDLRRRDVFTDSETIESLSLSFQNFWRPFGVERSASFSSDAIEASSRQCNGRPDDYLNMYDLNIQHTTRVNSDSGASSSVNWVGREIDWGHNLARITSSQRPGRRSSHYMLNRGLYNDGMTSLRIFGCDLIGHHQPSRSSVLLDKESDFEELEDSDILQLGKTKAGSLSLQKALSWKNLRVTDKIFEAVMSNVFDLMTDQYGHHLFIKLIEACHGNKLKLIVMNVTRQHDLFCDTAINQHGSQSIKKLIKLLVGSPLISFVVIALCGRVKDIMNNRTGASVVRQCLETLDDEQNKLLYEAVINNFRGIAVNEKGYLSFIELINNVRGPFRQPILNLVCDHAVFLSKDPSGNFIVQHAIGLHNPDLTEKICSELKGKYVELTMLKFGSHVVEKCLKSRGMAHYVVTDFLRSSNQQLLRVARHQYGNFVIQTALKVTKSEHSPLHEDLLLKLRGLNALQFGFGKNVYNLIANGVPVEHDIFLN